MKGVNISCSFDTKGSFKTIAFLIQRRPALHLQKLIFHFLLIETSAPIGAWEWKEIMTDTMTERPGHKEVSLTKL